MKLKLEHLQKQVELLKGKKRSLEKENKRLEAEIEHKLSIKWLAIGTPILLGVLAIVRFYR